MGSSEFVAVGRRSMDGGLVISAVGWTWDWSSWPSVGHYGREGVGGLRSHRAMDDSVGTTVGMGKDGKRGGTVGEEVMRMGGAPHAVGAPLINGSQNGLVAW